MPGDPVDHRRRPCGDRKAGRRRHVWSVETLRRWLAEKLGSSDVATLKQYVDILPLHLVRRFIDAEQTAVVVTGAFPTSTPASCCP